MPRSLFLIADAIVHAATAASVCFSAGGLEKEMTKEELDEIAMYVASHTMVSSRENLLLLIEKSLKS